MGARSEGWFVRLAEITPNYSATRRFGNSWKLSWTAVRPTMVIAMLGCADRPHFPLDVRTDPTSHFRFFTFQIQALAPNS